MNTAEVLRRIVEQDFKGILDPLEGDAIREFNKLLTTATKIRPQNLANAKVRVANEDWPADQVLLGLLNAHLEPNKDVSETPEYALAAFFQNRMEVPRVEVPKLIELIPRFVTKDQD